MATQGELDVEMSLVNELRKSLSLERLKQDGLVLTGMMGRVTGKIYSKHMRTSIPASVVQG